MRKKIGIIIITLAFCLSACGKTDSDIAEISRESYDANSQNEMIGSGTGEDEINAVGGLEKASGPATALLDNITVGWNLGNSLDCQCSETGYDLNMEQEIAWGNPHVTRDLIDFVHAQGFNAIRIPVSWAYNCGRDSEGNLLIGDKWLERVKDVVDYAYLNGMYVILNSHHDEKLFYIGTDSESFELVKKDAVSLWGQIATAFKDYDEHLLFESFNELHNMSLEEDGSQADKWIDVTRYTENGMKQLNELNQIFVDTVRSSGGYNAKRVLVLGSTYEGGRDIIMRNIVVPDDAVKGALVYDAHIYSDTVDQLFDEYLDVCSDFTDTTGVPVILGECGTWGSENYGYSPLSYRALAAANMVARADARGIKCFWWDNNNANEFGIINRKEPLASDFQMIRALIDGVDYEGYVNSSVVDLAKSNIDWIQGVLSVDHKDNDTIVHGDGEVTEKKTWGNFVNDQNGYGVHIPSGMDYMSCVLTGRANAWEFVILSYAFYDPRGKYIEGHYGSGKEMKISVPEGAEYVKFCLGDLHNNHSSMDFSRYIENGDLNFKISFINLPKAYIYLSVDDSTYDVDLSTALVMQEHGWPITLATEVQQLDQKVSGIEAYNSQNEDHYDSVGETVLDVCKWVQANGGEIAVHDQGYVWDADTVAKMISLYFADAYIKYNDENGTSLTAEEFIELVVSRLKETDNYNLDDPESAGRHFVERAEVLNAHGLKTYGILASGGSFKMKDYSGSLSIKSWGTTKAQEWASKYFVYSDQYGTSGNYYNPRHQMAAHVKNGSESTPGDFDDASFRESLQNCINKGGIHGYYWHYVSGSETAGGQYNRMSLDMYIRALNIIQEYVDSGDIAVVAPSVYYRFLGYAPSGRSLYASHGGNDGSFGVEVDGDSIDELCDWQQYVGVDGKGNMYYHNEIFKTNVLSECIEIEDGKEYVYVCSYNRNNRPKVRVHYYNEEDYFGRSETLSTGRTDTEVIIPIIQDATGFRIELLDVAESLKDDIVSGMHVYKR